MAYEFSLIVDPAETLSYDNGDRNPYVHDLSAGQPTPNAISLSESSSIHNSMPVYTFPPFADGLPVPGKSLSPSTGRHAKSVSARSSSTAPSTSEDSDASSSDAMDPANSLIFPESGPGTSGRFRHNIWGPNESATAPPPSITGSLDLATGVFRKLNDKSGVLRNQHACDGCRTRKAKCELVKNDPMERRCGRCRKKDLKCEYSVRRMRGPNKNKRKNISTISECDADAARPRQPSTSESSSEGSHNVPPISVVASLQVPPIIASNAHDDILTLGLSPSSISSLQSQELVPSLQSNESAEHAACPPFDHATEALHDLFGEYHTEKEQDWNQPSFHSDLDSYAHFEQPHAIEGLVQSSIFAPVATHPHLQAVHSAGQTLNPSPGDVLSLYSLSHADSFRDGVASDTPLSFFETDSFNDFLFVDTDSRRGSISSFESNFSLDHLDGGNPDNPWMDSRPQPEENLELLQSAMQSASMAQPGP